MNKKMENVLDAMENSGESAAAAVADHLRTVASNGPEYATREAMHAEAESLKGWAQFFITKASAAPEKSALYKCIEAQQSVIDGRKGGKLPEAITRAKSALEGDSNDEEHDALFELVEALTGGAQ